MAWIETPELVEAFYAYAPEKTMSELTGRTAGMDEVEVRASLAAALEALEQLGRAQHDIVEGQGPLKVCGCGGPVVEWGGRWLHVYNPALTGNDDHDADGGDLTEALRARARREAAALDEEELISEIKFMSGGHDLADGTVGRKALEARHVELSLVGTGAEEGRS